MNCMIILRDNLIFNILGKEAIMYLLKASITMVIKCRIPFKIRLTFSFPLRGLEVRVVDLKPRGGEFEAC